MEEEHPERNHFLGLLKSGNVVRKNKLSDIINIPSLEYILKADFHHRYIGITRATDWYHYTLIDRYGKPISLKIGNFEVIYINNDIGCTNFFGREIEIHDITNDTYHTYKAMYCSPNFIKIELIPLLEKLNEYGSWEEYRLSKDTIREFSSIEVYNLYKEVVQLRKEHEHFIREKNSLLKEREDFQDERERLLQKQNELLQECDNLHSNKKELLNKQNEILEEQNKLCQERDDLYNQLSIRESEYNNLLEKNNILQRKIHELSNIINSKGQLLKQLFK